MPSPASLLATGMVSALLATNGEPLTYANVSVAGLVNRDAVKVATNLRRLFGSESITFDTIGSTMIEVLFTGMSAAPAVGNSFLDGLGFRHRVQRVAQTDISWQCFCVATKAS